jgi:hypothetical protein
MNARIAISFRPRLVGRPDAGRKRDGWPLRLRPTVRAVIPGFGGLRQMPWQRTEKGPFEEPFSG